MTKLEKKKVIKVEERYGGGERNCLFSFLSYSPQV